MISPLLNIRTLLILKSLNHSLLNLCFVKQLGILSQRCLKIRLPGLDKITLKFITGCLPYIIPPITDIINLSSTQGIFPNSWKKAEVIPIPKTDEAEHASNNRPVSLLPILANSLQII